MQNVTVLAGNAQTHPTGSLVLGGVVVVLGIAFVWWLIGKVFK